MYISVLPQKDFTIKCPKTPGVSLNVWFCSSYIQNEVVAVAIIKKYQYTGETLEGFYSLVQLLRLNWQLPMQPI